MRKYQGLMCMGAGMASLFISTSAFAVKAGAIFQSLTEQGVFLKTFVVLVFGIAGIGLTGWGLWQATIGRANDPQVKLGESLMMAAVGGLIAAVVGSTSTFQETFGITPGTSSNTVISNQ